MFDVAGSDRTTRSSADCTKKQDNDNKHGRNGEWLWQAKDGIVA
jgi:hypothetical protein